MWKRIGISFIGTLAALVLLVFVTTLIPRSAVRENLLQSATYLREQETTFYMMDGKNTNTLVHNYADAITLSVMYSMDYEYPVGDLFLGYFYSDNGNKDYPMLENLYAQVNEELEADAMYDRYWHGMVTYLRPLLTVMDIRGIRVVSEVILFGLLGWLSFLLWKKKAKLFAVLLWVVGGLILLPMVPLCMEYFGIWPVALVASIFVARGTGSRKELYGILTAAGVACAFFDFLTTETVTFMLPIMVWMVLFGKKEGWKELFRTTVFAGGLWFMAYAGTYLFKWTLASLITGSNRFTDAFLMIGVRQGSAVNGIISHALHPADAAAIGGGDFSQPMQAVLMNLRQLLGIGTNLSLWQIFWGFLVLVLALVCFVFLYHKKGQEFACGGMLLLLGLLPFVRFVVMNNHSLGHYFFTYRALYCSIICLVLGLYEGTDRSLFAKKKTSHVGKRGRK